jgi:hypothetical protein
MANLATNENLTGSVLTPEIGAPITFRPIKPVLPMPVLEPILATNKAVTTTPTIGHVPEGSALGTPVQLWNLAVTTEPYKVNNTMYVLVSLTYSYDTGDPNFGGANVWIQGYHGNLNPVLVASGKNQPFSFIADATNEAVILSAVAVSPTGISADISHAPSANFTLSPVSSAPPAPTVSQDLTAIAGGGYQFTFNFEAGLVGTIIACYNVYRNTTNSFSGATKIRSVLQDSTNTGSYIFQDALGTSSGTFYYYFVTAVDVYGNESSATSAQTGAVQASPLTPSSGAGKNALSNPGFESNTGSYPTNTSATTVGQYLCDGWFVSECDNATYSFADYYTGGNHWGNRNLLLRAVRGSASIPSNNTWYVQRTISAPIPVYVGMVFSLSGWISCLTSLTPPSGVTVLGGIGYFIYDASGNLLAEVHPYSDVGAAQSYTQYISQETVAATYSRTPPSFIRIECFTLVKNNSGSTWTVGSSDYFDFHFDDLSVVLVSNLDTEVIDGSVYGRVAANCLASGVPYVYKGAYSGSVAYVQGNEVSYNGNYYICILGGTGQTPAPAGTSYWKCAGPTSMDVVTDGAVYIKLSGVNVDNTLHISSPLTNQGSLTQVGHYTFSYTSTSSSITWSWTSFDCYAPDGSTITVTSGSQAAFTGLSNTTTYYFGMYVSMNYDGTGTAYVVKSDVSSGKAPESVTQKVQTVNADGHIPVSVNVTAATGSSGGGVGGGDSCFSPNTKVQTQRGNISFSQLKIGDSFLTSRGTYRPVTSITRRPYKGRALDMGNDEIVTPEHLFLDGDLWVPVLSLNKYSEVYYTGEIWNAHLQTEIDDDGTRPETEHSYVLANGEVVHNLTT